MSILYLNLFNKTDERFKVKKELRKALLELDHDEIFVGRWTLEKTAMSQDIWEKEEEDERNGILLLILWEIQNIKR